MASTEVNNVDHRAPNVRHLVYSMYRKMLDEYNDQANEIVDALPRDIVQEDADIYKHLQEILKQQHQPAANSAAAADGPQVSQAPAPPPPPPPPPSLPSTIQGRRLKTELPERGLEPPAAIQNAMMTKDKKPFTYTPGGLDLSEIRSPRMQRRINRNACAEEMSGRPAPTANQALPTSPPPPAAYSTMQSQLPTSVLPARGIVPPPPPPPAPQSGGADNVPPPPPPPPPLSATATAAPSQPKPPAFHKPPQMGFDPNEILARANRSQSQEAAPKSDVRQSNNFVAEPARNFKSEEEPLQKANDIVQAVSRPPNEPGQIYVPPISPKSPCEATPAPTMTNHLPRGQLGSIFVPPVTNTVQESNTPTPTSPYSYKVQNQSPASSPMSPPTADAKPQAPWVTVYRTPQTTPPAWMSSRQPESPKPQGARIIPIQIEGRDTPKPQSPQQQQQQPMQYSVQPPQQQHPQSQYVVQSPQPQQQQYSVQQPQQQQYSVQQPQQEAKQQNRPHTRVIPIQIEGSSGITTTQQSQVPGQGYQNKFNPLTPHSPTPYTPPCMEKEQKPQWAPVQPRPFVDGPFAGQQRVQNEPQSRVQRNDAQPQPEYGTYNTAGVPLSQLRKMQLSDDDRALMDKFKSQIEKHGNDAITDENANPRYRGGHIPSRVFKMLDESVDDENYLHRESDPRYRGGVIPSRAFRLLQNMTDTAGEMPQQVPKSPVRAPASRPVPVAQEPPSGPYIPASEQQVQEPRKYTGGSIPSRSFRMLQAMTGQEITAPNQANSSSGRNTPMAGMSRWCPTPVFPPVDPYWYLYHSDPFFMYNYVSDINATYGYPTPQPHRSGRFTPTPTPTPPPTHFQHHPSYMSDSDEQGYSSTDELGQYYANYRNRMAYSPYVMYSDAYYRRGGSEEYAATRSETPSILITPAGGAKGARGRIPETSLHQTVEKKFVESAKVSETEDSVGESESSSEEETETETETDVEPEKDSSNEVNRSAQRMHKNGGLQTLKSVSDVGIYASESTATVTNGDDWEDTTKSEDKEVEEVMSQRGVEEEEEDEEEEEEEEEEESSESMREPSQDNLPHQLSVIFEESEHSDVESIRHKENSMRSFTKSFTSESEESNLENGEEESDDDVPDTESSVTVRLPLKLKFSRSENDEEVTMVVVGDSEMKRCEEQPTKEKAQVEEAEEIHGDEDEDEDEGNEEDEDADVSVVFSLPSRSNSVISVASRVFERGDTEKSETSGSLSRVEVCDGNRENVAVEPEVTVKLCLPLRKQATKPREDERAVVEEPKNLDRASCESRTEESDSTHCEDDSSSTSADTVVKHKEDTDEEEAEKTDEHKNKMEDFKYWMDKENGIDWYEKTAATDTEKNTIEDISYEAGVGRLEQMISSMLEKTKDSLKRDTAKQVKKENSQEESEDDSGVTSDMSVKHLASETDVDTESDYSELCKMTQCQRASTHSRLFKLLQEECGLEDAAEEEKSKKEPKTSPSSESLTSRKQRLTLPLNTSSEAESLSSSSGVTSPSSPTVNDRLVKELVHSLLHKKRGKKFRKLPLAKLHAAALRILQEDMDSYDTSSNSASGDDGFLLSPVQKTIHSPSTANATESNPQPEVLPNMVYGANYYDYLDYYNTWGNAAAAYYAEPECDVVPSRAFRMLSLQQYATDGFGAKCPRVLRDGDVAAAEKPSGRQTPAAMPRADPRESDCAGMTFAEKREKVSKVLETAGKC